MTDFHKLLEAQIPRLRRYARALTRDARADDLVQDTLLRAIAKQDRWEPGTNLRAWLFTLMHNQHVNNVRRANREAGTVDIDEVSSSLTAVSDPTASRQLRELERALGELPSEQREVILLVGLEGFSYDQVAEILAVPIGPVAVVARARRATPRTRYGSAPHASGFECTDPRDRNRLEPHLDHRFKKRNDPQPFTMQS